MSLPHQADSTPSVLTITYCCRARSDFASPSERFVAEAKHAVWRAARASVFRRASPFEVSDHEMLSRIARAAVRAFMRGGAARSRAARGLGGRAHSMWVDRVPTG